MMEGFRLLMLLLGVFPSVAQRNYIIGLDNHIFQSGICKTEPSQIVLKVLHRNGAAIKNGSMWSFLREGDTVVLRDGDAIALHVTRPLQKNDPCVDAEHTLTFCADPDSDETVEEH